MNNVNVKLLITITCWMLSILIKLICYNQSIIKNLTIQLLLNHLTGITIRLLIETNKYQWEIKITKTKIINNNRSITYFLFLNVVIKTIEDIATTVTGTIQSIQEDLFASSELIPSSWFVVLLL